MLKAIYKFASELGSGLFFIAILVGIFAFVILVVPWLIGWGFHYLLAIWRNTPEITDFWIRWFTGVALSLVGYCFYGSSSSSSSD